MKIFSLITLLLSLSFWSSANDLSCPQVLSGQESYGAAALQYIDPMLSNGSFTLKDQIAQDLSGTILKMSVEDIKAQVELPKMAEHGDLAITLFKYGKEQKGNPIQITQEAADALNANKPEWLEEANPIKGFLNFKLKSSYLQQLLAESFQLRKETYGSTSTVKDQTIVVDYGSPNVAKEMHVGHMRASALGQAIYNLARSQGYKAIGLNHLGDWGVQFGKLVWAYRQWKDEYDFENEPFKSLSLLYARFNKEAKEKKELHDVGSKIFKDMEDGVDQDALKLWGEFIAITNVENQKLWDIIGVKHDLIRGESFYSDMIPDFEKKLESLGLLEENDGAMVVCLGEDMPPCLIKKADGASLYATRDLISAEYRRDVLGADKMVYVVGSEQSLHFKQVFSVLDKMGHEWHTGMSHVSFGLIRLNGQKLSSREGNVITLKDVLNQAIDFMTDKLKKTDTKLKGAELKALAKQMAVGAVLFGDLSNDRTKNVDFDWDQMLSFEGDTGPYVQQCGTKCKAIMNSYESSVGVQDFAADFTTDQERKLMLQILLLPEVISKAFDQYKPHILAQHMLDIAKGYNAVHNMYAENGGLEKGVDEDTLASRLLLTKMTWQSLVNGMGILSIEIPEKM